MADLLMEAVGEHRHVPIVRRSGTGAAWERWAAAACGSQAGSGVAGATHPGCVYAESGIDYLGEGGA